MKNKLIMKATLTGKVENRNFAESSCILPVSVGQKYHEGEKFFAAARLAKSTFKEVFIFVADTLQRRTKALKHPMLSEEKLRFMCIGEGKDWIKKNKKAIDFIGDKLVKIIHWDYWLNEPDYQEKRTIVNELYAKGGAFKKSVDRTVANYSKRAIRQHKGETPDFDNIAKTNSREYILEECAVLLLWAKYKYNFITYPKKLTEPMHHILMKFVYNRKETANLLQYMQIKLKKKPQTIQLPVVNKFNFNPSLKLIENGAVSPGFFKRQIMFSSGNRKASKNITEKLIFTQIDVIALTFESLPDSGKMAVLSMLKPYFEKIILAQDKDFISSENNLKSRTMPTYNKDLLSSENDSRSLVY